MKTVTVERIITKEEIYECKITCNENASKDDIIRLAEEVGDWEYLGSSEIGDIYFEVKL